MTEPGDDHASPAIRIGTAERNAALKALDAHLEAGRLDAMEYGDRSAHVAEARTADEIRPLFADLPAPHPQLPGDRGDAGIADAGGTGDVATTSDDGGGGLQVWGPRLAMVLPLVVLGLVVFVSGHLWWLFLVLPMVGMLGGKGHHGGHRHGRRDRHRFEHGSDGSDRGR